MHGADAVVFAGGIGENSSEIRKRICEGLEWFGLTIDEKTNTEIVNGKEGVISTKDSKLKAYVIPTNEELLIARDTVRCVKNVPRRW
jgi:acetate kinase